MRVFVKNMRGEPLMPCTQRKARLLLKAGKARICKYHPFTIQLDYATGETKQECTVGIDTGSKNIGIAVRSEDKVLFKGEQVFRDGKYQVVDGHIYNTTKSEKTGGILAGFLSDFGDLLLPLDFPVAGSTVVGDQVLLVFSDALETDFCRIFTASMLTKGE